MKIENDKYVTINYTLKNDEGKIIDTSIGKENLGYIQGRGMLLPKLEEQLLNLTPGEKLETIIEAKDGYGEYHKELVTEVDRSNFETDMPIEPGMMFQAMTAAGPQIVRVSKVTDDKITVDGNHELAGVRLHFEIEVVDVRDATEEELKPQGCGGGCGGHCGGNCGGGDCDCGGDGCNCDGDSCGGENCNCKNN